LGKLFTHVPL